MLSIIYLYMILDDIISSAYLFLSSHMRPKPHLIQFFFKRNLCFAVTFRALFHLMSPYVTLCRYWHQVLLVIYCQIRINFLYISCAWSANVVQFCFIIIRNILVTTKSIDTIFEWFYTWRIYDICKKLIPGVDDSLRKWFASYFCSTPLLH